MLRRLLPPVLALLLALPLLAGANPVPPAFRLSDTGVHGSELNVGVSPNGKIFVGGWDRVARSDDDGLTWVKLNPRPVGFAADRVLIVDKTTGRVLIDDTYLGCTVLTWSDNDGATWTNNAAACGQGVTDHQKIAVGKRVTLPDTGLYPNLIYVCANGLSHTDCGVSNDGGLTFQGMAPHGTGCAFQGVPVANSSGTLFEPTSQCGLKVRRTPNAGLTWGEISLGPAFPASRDTPDLGITSDDVLYVFYTDNNWKPAFARSTNGGLTWTGPYAVNVPGLVSSVFPSVVGGAPGRIALSFYATTDDPAGWDKNPGNAPASVRWHGYVAIVADADQAAPTPQVVQVTPANDPLQIGFISKLGSNLNNIADYMDVDVGPDGRVYAVFTDGCLPPCATKAQSTSDRAIVAVQTAGPRLR